MKPFLSLTFVIILAAFISSCQKETSQAPAAKAPASALQTNSLAVVPTSGLAYTVNLGMIDYYPFHGDAADVSGHGHTGNRLSLLVPPDFSNTLPPPSPTANKYGIPDEAFLFNGISDEIESTTPVFDASAAQTQFCFYARYKSNGTGTLISSGTIGNPGTTGFELTVEKDEILFYWSDNFPGAPGTSPGRFFALSTGAAPLAACTNSWVDIALNFTYPVLTMYINGKQVAAANAQTSPLPGFPQPGHFGSNLRVGCTSNGVNRFSNFFNSAIDEVRIYNRPLTTDEISYLYAH